MEKINNLAYIDESNILSTVGNSVYVCVCIVSIYKNDMAIKIENFEKELKISYTHWVDMPWKLRLKFAEKIRRLDFVCKVIVYKNPIKQSQILENFLSRSIKPEDRISEIIIDGSHGIKYERALKSSLRLKGVKVFRLKFVDDKNEPLVRLADFMAGSYRSFLDNGSQDGITIYNLLRHKIKILN